MDNWKLFNNYRQIIKLKKIIYEEKSYKKKTLDKQVDIIKYYKDLRYMIK